MVSKILKKNNIFYCSNCRMRQFQIKTNCPFCGNMFSNYEEILIQQFNEEERNKNESNLSRES